MRIAVFSSKPWDKEFLGKKFENKHELTFISQRLEPESVDLVKIGGKEHEAVCIFVNDDCQKETVEKLKSSGIKLILLRCAGTDNVDLEAAKSAGIRVYSVPGYSPNAVAEHAVALVLSLNRKTHKSYNRVREANFNLDGLLGFDIKGKTVGVFGTGRIGAVFANIMKGFGAKLLAYDVYKNENLVKETGISYVSLDEMLSQSDIISIHMPLTKETTHIINDENIEKMKKGVMIVNTSRGPLVDTKAVIRGLKTGKIGYLGLDVYEEEKKLFYEDRSGDILGDDVFARLLTFPNVIITGHQAFFTKEAQENIVSSTLENVSNFLEGKDTNEQTKEQKK